MVYRVRFFILLFLMTGTLSAADGRLIFGIHPYLSASKISEKYTPLVKIIEKELGMNVVLKVAKDYEDHIKNVGEDGVDIALLGPISYVQMVNLYWEKPLLARFEKEGSPLLYGHIIVRKDSPIRSLKDLKGRVFAFGDSHSTLSFVVPKLMLKNSGVKLKDLGGYKHFNSHNNVAYAVLSGEAEAGAVKDGVFRMFKEKGIKSLQETAKFSEHPFVTKATMDPILIGKLKAILLNVHKTKEGKAAIKKINSAMTAFVKVEDGDYDSLREIVKKR